MIRLGVEILEDIGYQFLGTRSSDVATFLKVNAQASYHTNVACPIAMSIAKAHCLTGGTQDGDYEVWKGFARTRFIITFGHEVTFEAASAISRIVQVKVLVLPRVVPHGEEAHAGNTLGIISLASRPMAGRQPLSSRRIETGSCEVGIPCKKVYRKSTVGNA